MNRPSARFIGSKRVLTNSLWYQHCVNTTKQARSGSMRIKIIQPPTVACIDGVPLDQFRPGNVYCLGNLLAGVFLAEGWAEPVDDPENGSRSDAEVPAIPRNLTREFFPPYYDG